jgi:hypothetical protein
MDRIHELRTILPDEPDHMFIAAASFERRRSIEAVRHFRDYSCMCGVVIRFTSSVNRSAGRRKERSVTHLLRTLTDVDRFGAPRLVAVERDDYLGLLDSLYQEIDRRRLPREGLRITLDITCLTRVQVVCLIRTLLVKGIVSDLRIVYTGARSYALGPRKLSYPTFSPLTVPLFSRENEVSAGSARLAIVLMGHEGLRTLSVWRRVDPERTVFLLPKSPETHITDRALKESRFLLDHAEVDPCASEPIAIAPIDIRDTQGQVVRILNCLAREEGVAVSLLPFGPKPMLVGAVLGLWQSMKVTSELAYSVASGYDAGYSVGVSGLYSEFLIRDGCVFKVAE